MRLDPVEDWINAIALLHQKPGSKIVAPDPSRGTSRCFLIEAVGEKAAAAGYKRGDIVIATSVYDLIFYGGSFHRVTFKLETIFNRVLEVDLSEFVLLDGQTPATSVELGMGASA